LGRRKKDVSTQNSGPNDWQKSLKRYSPNSVSSEWKIDVNKVLRHRGLVTDSGSPMPVKFYAWDGRSESYVVTLENDEEVVIPVWEARQPRH
jgi:hypothetical protein